MFTPEDIDAFVQAAGQGYIVLVRAFLADGMSVDAIAASRVLAHPPAKEK